MNPFVIFGVTSLMSLLVLTIVFNCVNAINEDQIIICVRDNVTMIDLICHTYDIDDIDWYQEISENNYGQFGNLDDSFNMDIRD
jgi:hypothetical protein